MRQEFYQSLVEWRSEYGLPLSFIVMGTLEQVQDLTLGGGSVRIQIMSSTTTDWLFHFFKYIQVLPLEWKVVWNLIQEYQHGHASCTNLLQSLIQTISSQFYTSKGSFVWDLARFHSADFVAWFCTYETAKTYLSSTDTYGWEKYQALEQCRQIQGHLQHLYKGMILGLPLFVKINQSHAGAAGIGIGNETMKETLLVLAKLHEWISEESSVTTTDADNNNSVQKEALQRFLDPNKQVKDSQKINIDGKTTKTIKAMIQELIILVVAAQQQQHDTTTTTAQRPPDAETIQAGLTDMIKTIFEQLGEQIDMWFGQWIEHCPLFVEEDEKKEEFQKEVHLRLGTIHDLPQPAKIMYSLLEGRLSIGREEWLHDFGGSVEDFTLGVWFLIVTGLLQRKRARGGRIIYEKVAVVWTS